MNRQQLPRHVAVSLAACDDPFAVLNGLLKEQVSLDIPIVTIDLSSMDISNVEGLFAQLESSTLIHQKKMKVLVLGDWYDTPLVDEIKSLMDSTYEYDSFFLALCFRYDGREELLKAVRIVAKRQSQGRVATSDVTAGLIKESIISSYFVAPELIVETLSSYSGLLLWDAPGAIIYFEDSLHRKGKLSLTKALQFYSGLKTV